MRVHLRPSGSPIPVAGPTTQKATTTQPAAVAGIPQYVSGFGQMFDEVGVDQIVTPRAGGDPRLADLLTCWGPGQVNLRRVTPEALRIVAGSLTTIEQTRLIEARNALFAGKGLPPTTGPVDADPVRRIVAAARIDAATQRGAPGMTGHSACYSLWITARDGRRVTHTFTVVDATDKEHPRTTAFVW
jgi:hypothetical protein